MGEVEKANMEQPSSEMLRAMESLRAMLPNLAESAELLAKIAKAHYDAYRAEGFSSEQALFLAKIGSAKPMAG